MVWPFTRKPSGEVATFTETGKRIFKEILKGDSYAGKVFRAASAADRTKFWKSKERDIAEWVSGDVTDRDRTLRLRAKYAERVEDLALARYYTNLPEADRELFAKYALESTREEQDRRYYYLSAIQLLDCKILEAFFIYGWEGDDGMPKKLIEMAGLLDEQCNLQYALMLESAKLKSEGRQLSDAQKEKGKLDMLLKEAARRRLAGIPFDDETPST